MHEENNLFSFFIWEVRLSKLELRGGVPDEHSALLVILF